MKPLEEIIDEIQEYAVIYNIHFCRAGVGFQMYYGDGTEVMFQDKLSVEQYYPDIRTAAEWLIVFITGVLTGIVI